MALARAGCDDREIASHSGHSSRDMIREHAGKARQTMRAKQALEKRLRTEQVRNGNLMTSVMTS